MQQFLLPALALCLAIALPAVSFIYPSTLARRIVRRQTAYVQPLSLFSASFDLSEMSKVNASRREWSYLNQYNHNLVANTLIESGFVAHPQGVPGYSNDNGDIPLLSFCCTVLDEKNVSREMVAFMEALVIGPYASVDTLMETLPIHSLSDALLRLPLPPAASAEQQGHDNVQAAMTKPQEDRDKKILAVATKTSLSSLLSDISAAATWCADNPDASIEQLSNDSLAWLVYMSLHQSLHAETMPHKVIFLLDESEESVRFIREGHNSQCVTARRMWHCLKDNEVSIFIHPTNLPAWVTNDTHLLNYYCSHVEESVARIAEVVETARRESAEVKQIKAKLRQLAADIGVVLGPDVLSE